MKSSLILDIFVITFVIKNVSLTEAENPLVDVEAFPTIAPIELNVEQEFKKIKIKKNLAVFTN